MSRYDGMKIIKREYADLSVSSSPLDLHAMIKRSGQAEKLSIEKSALARTADVSPMAMHKLAVKFEEGSGKGAQIKRWKADLSV